MSQIRQYLRLAYTALMANKGRSLLTTLGIVIGIAMVIIVFSLGNATSAVVTAEVESYGSNTVVVEVKTPGLSDMSAGNATAMVEGVTITTLKEEDMEAMFDIPGVTGGYAAVIGLERVVSIYDDQSYMIQATSASFVEIDQSDVEYGRYFTEVEDKALARVAVLGAKTAEELFPGIDPIGQSVRIGEINLKIIGVMKERGMVFFQDMDSQVYVPLNTMQKLIMGVDYVPYFILQTSTEDIAFLVKDDVIEELDKRHNITNIDRRDFRVTTMSEAMEIMDSVTGALSILLIVLAAISLIVGGVGVMNVMFVIVSERTREIGLRKAVGASEKDILYQFLTEAVMVTIVGGFLGVVSGLSAVYLFTVVAGLGGIAIDFVIPFGGIVIALVAAAVEGLLFGVYPAKKAASLNPIDSLRFE
ncbi:hypothetical protein COW94_02875 [Candidatus Peregrinibacteria bacterium CG22_combo_CG10-13_8_21_14_all_44_10]|nr:MAG: hypothetical protein COW94_02875 [Candidatus Peregrinibacteria bacterium CG22_combo_CG10-13_8_21_14_all_44_10]PIX79643.1 MAG: hypothetical protein COZ35_03115 [Candidatus Peregrinibacteria bacterium CG_4_10_14_3_um_filter_44_21]PJB88281.1 MAG: hypothetical protein CO082_05130 [Candidatus Peregrinibacteria bacterium CG_4_9_14_0_8_um_filter_44_15]